MQKIEYMIMNTLQTFVQRRQSGTGQKKGASGIQSILRKCTKTGNLLTSFVSNVGTSFKQKTASQVQDSVLTNANQPTDVKQESTTLTGHVKNAEQSFESTNMLRKSIAQKRVVYNLTVEDKHEFFANGILVHNCLRYILAELPDNPDSLINQSYGMALNASGTREDAFLPHALQDDPVETNDDWYSYY